MVKLNVLVKVVFLNFYLLVFLRNRKVGNGERSADSGAKYSTTGLKKREPLIIHPSFSVTLGVVTQRVGWSVVN